MANKAKKWVIRPPKQVKPKISAVLKAELEKRGNELVENVIKPRSIQPPPKDGIFNYIVDIHSSWYRNYFYLSAKYACPAPNSLAPFFDVKFARMEYIGTPDRFNLSFLRHNGAWSELYLGLPLSECLTALEDDPFFQL